MDINLTGYLWGMPANMTGEIIGPHWMPNSINLTGSINASLNYPIDSVDPLKVWLPSLLSIALVVIGGVVTYLVTIKIE